MQRTPTKKKNTQIIQFKNKGPEWTFLQRRYINDQEVDENMLNITSR